MRHGLTVKAADFLKRKLVNYQEKKFADIRKSKDYQPDSIGVQADDDSSEVENAYRSNCDCFNYLYIISHSIHAILHQDSFPLPSRDAVNNMRFISGKSTHKDFHIHSAHMQAYIGPSDDQP